MTTKIEVGQIYEDKSIGELLFVTQVITENTDPPYVHYYYLKAPQFSNGNITNSLWHAEYSWKKVKNGEV